jgi:hypothetical protein
MSTEISPKTIDTNIAQLSATADKLQARQARIRAAIAHKLRVGANNGVRMTTTALDAQLADLGKQSDAVVDAICALDKIHRVIGWSRYYIVPDGHIHANQHCSTFNRGLQPTDVRWLPEQSGRTADDMIAEYTTAMCTVCFPDAPAAPAYTEAVRKSEADKQEARDAKAAKRQAADDATPKDSSGQPLTVDGRSPKTLRGAQNLLAEFLGDVHWYRLAAENSDGRKHPSEQSWLDYAAIIAESIALLTGQAPDVVYTQAWNKAEKSATAKYRKAVREGR